MKIINQSRGTVLAERAEEAATIIRRMKGLLGRKTFSPQEALLIKPCNSVHTFFMRFAIDVLFLDRNNRVIMAIPALQPFRITAVYFKARSAVELPAGTIHSSKTSPGDIILLG